MTSKMHWVYQGLAVLLHAINLFGGVVPTKYQALVAFALALVNAGLGLYNHYFTPAGARIAALFLLFLFPSFARAQAVAPAPTQHFSLSGSVVSFMGPGGAAPASIADGYFNLTPNFSVGYQQITVPSIASARLGMGAYSKPLSSWAGKRLTKKFVFDATKINVTLLVGVGKLTQSIDNVNHIAETAGVCVDYPVGGNVSIKLVCGQWLHGGMVNGLIGNIPIPAQSSSTAAISSGVKVHF